MRVTTTGRRVISSYRLFGRENVQQRWKSTAASTSLLKEELNQPSTAEDSEWSTAKPYEQIPGNLSLPIIGTTWIMLPVVGAGIELSRILELHRIRWKNFGKIWKDSFPGLPRMVTTTCPQDAEKLFRLEGKFPERPPFETLIKYREKRVEDLTKGGLLVGNGESWYQTRSKSQQPLLKTRNVNHYVPVLGNIADEFIDRIRLIRLENNEMKPDFVNEMYRWALESVAVVGFNTRLGCLNPNLAPNSEAQKMIDAANISFSTMSDIEMGGLPIWKFYETPALKKLYEAQDFFTDTTIKYINQTMEAVKKRPADSDEEPSILEELFIRGMSPKEATVMVIDMLMAGIDTTSHTTSFLFYLLAKNSSKQEKLRQEILSVVGPRGSPITSSALNELHYLKACVKESLRLRPAVVTNARITNRDLVLSGYRVPKGTAVLVSHQLMGELEEFFPNPQEYIPERWIKGDPQESHHHPYTLLPFGFGTRMCIGRRLAELEMWQLTVKVLQNFKIEYHYEDIGCFNRAVIAPDQPLRFKFIDLK